MSPVATSTMATDIEAAPSALLQALYQALDAPSCTTAARTLAQHVATRGLRTLAEDAILEDLTRASKSKSGFERESACVGFEQLFRTLGDVGGAEPYFLPLLPIILDRCAETGKGEVVREAAERAAKALVKLAQPEAVPLFMDSLFSVLRQSGVKWKTKVFALELLEKLSAQGKDQVAQRLGAIIPKISKEMQDTKTEVSSAAHKTGLAMCGVLSNPDVLPFVPLLVNCMARPDTVPEAIKAMSANVWVRDVDGPTLAVLVPLLNRALAERSTVVQRQTAVLTANLFKLVRSPELAHVHLATLLPGVQRMAEGAAFPEVRAFATEAQKALVIASGATDEEVEAAHRSNSAAPSPAPSIPGSPKSAQVDEDAVLAQKMLTDMYTSQTELVKKREFSPELWQKYSVPYLKHQVGSSDQAQRMATKILEAWLKVDQDRHRSDGDGQDDGVEKIVDLSFSLAYGGLLLLNHTRLNLRKGGRYAALGANGCGKSTLLKAINQHRIDNFPENVSTFYVEHDIDGEDTNASCVDFLAADKYVKTKGLSRGAIEKRLREFGFDDSRISLGITALSGGWKMRLALARAMLCEADLLLLDEPTNHLDVKSIAWLVNYLTTSNVTILTVSHDSGFLDDVATDCIHYQNKQLVYYRGNLSKFVEKYPAAKSYYTLSASIVKFTFPSPGALMGVRSQTRAILKATNCTFTYPGSATPSLMDASCAVTLSSRIGVVGPNGAGKSTLIKLLTGETVPDIGKVEKHPNLRIAYVAQHAFHNIGQHFEKSAVQYIAWRYQDGHDRETAMKATRKLSEEEKAQMKVAIEGRNGEKRFLEMIIGRQKLKKSFQYECKWKGLDHRFNAWLPRERLIELGFSKLVQEHDDLEASREGAGTRDLSFKSIRQHLMDVGLDGDIAEYNEMKGLSGGQRVKVVIAAALWSKPQVLIMDEPTNFLDRDALGGLAVAIRDWAGAFVCISHNEEFVGALCPEIWNVDQGRITHKGKAAKVDGDAFEDGRKLGIASKNGSRVGTPMTSLKGTPEATPSASGAENSNELGMPIVRKKKLTRKQLKERDERRRARKLKWLSDSTGAPREPDTDTEDEH